jgi:hypothetical protein
MDPNSWAPFIIVALVGLLFAVTPRLTRPDLFFAVTVAPALRATEVGGRALRLYRAGSLGSTLLALVCLWLAGTGGSPAFALLAVLLGALLVVEVVLR